MDIKEIEKHRPKIAAAVILITLGIIFIPKLFVDKSRIGGSGTVEIKEVDVASRISSRVMTLVKNEGDTVKKGEQMALLDDSIVAAQNDAASAVFKNAKDTYNRFQNMLDSQSVSQQQFDAARANYISAMSQLKQAEVMAAEASVIAPWDGIVLKRHVEEGELVSPNSPLFTIGDLSEAKVTIYLPLKEMTLLKYGMPAEVTIDAYKDKKFEGKITYISGEAEFTPKNVQTQDERIKEVFEVQVTVPNPGAVLKPGIPADVIVNISKN